MNSFVTGYNLVWTGEAEKEEETALKKYQRLNCEVRELMDDIKAAADSGSEDKAGLAQVSLELEKMHSTLVQVIIISDWSEYITTHL